MGLLASLLLPLDEPAGPEGWLIRRSQRARRLSARVHADGRVEIVVPERVGRLRVLDFIARHRDWITQRLSETAPQMPEAFPPRRLELQALGQTWHLHLAGGTGALRIRAQANQLLVLSGRGEREAQVRALRSWLTEHVRAPLTTKLRGLAVHHGFDFQSLQLRRQRTRWGSCSSRGVISLNICAVFQPPAVLDYLMIHELAHTREMNHSRAYWRTVASCCPDWRRLDRELATGWRHVPQWIFES